jgi:hypothetical protein
MIGHCITTTHDARDGFHYSIGARGRRDRQRKNRANLKKNTSAEKVDEVALCLNPQTRNFQEVYAGTGVNSRAQKKLHPLGPHILRTVSGPSRLRWI